MRAIRPGLRTLAVSVLLAFVLGLLLLSLPLEDQGTLESLSPGRDVAALETDLALGNKTISATELDPGRSVRLSITITNTGELDEFFRVQFRQEYDWVVSVEGVYNENDSSPLGFTRTGDWIDLVNATPAGEAIFLDMRLAVPGMENDLNFTKRETFEELGIYANREVVFTVRVLCSSDNYATRKDAVYRMNVNEYHGVICLSEEYQGNLDRYLLQYRFVVHVTHVSNLFEGDSPDPIILSLTSDPTPAQWEVSLSKGSFELLRGRSRDVVVYVNATEDSLSLDDPFYYELTLLCRETISGNGVQIPFRVFIKQEGKFQFIAGEGGWNRTCTPGSSVSFGFGVKNVGLGLDIIRLTTSSSLEYWEETSLETGVLEPNQTQYIHLPFTIPVDTDLMEGEVVELIVEGRSGTTPSFSERLRLEITVETYYGFQFEGEYSGYINSSEPASYTIRLNSSANVEQIISFSILDQEVQYFKDGVLEDISLGDTLWYASVYPGTISLQAGGSQVVTVTVGTFSSGGPGDYMVIGIRGAVQNMPEGNTLYRDIITSTTVSSYSSISLDFEFNTTSVVARSQNDIFFTLSNTGNIEEVVELIPVCVWEETIATRTLVLQPHTSKRLSVEVKVPWEVTGSSVLLTVRGVASGSGVFATDTTSLLIETSHGVNLHLLEGYEVLRAVPGNQVAFVLNVSNLGNIEDEFTLNTQQSNTEIILQKRSVELEAFGYSHIVGWVKLPEGMDSGLRFHDDYSLEVTASSREDPGESASTNLTIFPLMVDVEPSLQQEKNNYIFERVFTSNFKVANVWGSCLRDNSIQYMFTVVNIHNQSANLSFQFDPPHYSEVVTIALQGERDDPIDTGDPLTGLYVENFQPFQSKTLTMVVNVGRSASSPRYYFSLEVRNLVLDGYETVTITTYNPRFDMKIVDLEPITESFEGRKMEARLTIFADGSLTGIPELDEVLQLVENIQLQISVDGGQRLDPIWIKEMRKGESRTITVSWKSPEMGWLDKEKDYEVVVDIRGFSSYQAEGQDDNPDNDRETFEFTTRDSSFVNIFPGSGYTRDGLALGYWSYVVVCFIALAAFTRFLDKFFKKRRTDRQWQYPGYLFSLGVACGLVYSFPLDGRTYNAVVAIMCLLGFIIFSFYYSYRARHPVVTLVNSLLPYLVFFIVITVGSSPGQFLSVLAAEFEPGLWNVYFMAFSVFIGFLGFLLGNKQAKELRQRICEVEKLLFVMKQKDPKIIDYFDKLLKGGDGDNVL